MYVASLLHERQQICIYPAPPIHDYVRVINFLLIITICNTHKISNKINRLKSRTVVDNQY